MKKKLALMCLAGVMVFGAGACGNKNDETVSTEQATETESVSKSEMENTQESSTETATEIEYVRNREDYIGLSKLDIDEYVTLADYKNMQVSAVKPEVTDEIIESYINSTLLVGNITNRAVATGDVVNIDFEGKKDGVAFEGGTAQGYSLEIGSNSFIAGFEDGLIGVNPGETVDLNLTFPENYTSAELAGQEVVFTVTVNSIKGSAEYASVTVEDMAGMGLEYASKEEVWEAGKKAVEESAQQAFKTNSQSAIVQKLVEESTVNSIPQWLVDEEMQNYTSYMEGMVKGMYGVDIETFVTSNSNMTLDEYNAQVNEMCELTIKQNMVFEAVAAAEGIEITEDMVKEKAAEEAAGYNHDSADTFLDEVGYDTYRTYMVNQEVLNKLVEIVKVEEKAAEEAAEVTTEVSTAQ